jgi:hypothetical protein
LHHPRAQASAKVTDDQRYLLLFIEKGCLPEDRVWVVDLEHTPVVSILATWTKAVNVRVAWV